MKNLRVGKKIVMAECIQGWGYEKVVTYSKLSGSWGMKVKTCIFLGIRKIEVNYDFLFFH